MRVVDRLREDEVRADVGGGVFATRGVPVEEDDGRARLDERAAAAFR